MINPQPQNETVIPEKISNYIFWVSVLFLLAGVIKMWWQRPSPSNVSSTDRKVSVLEAPSVCVGAIDIQMRRGEKKNAPISENCIAARIHWSRSDGVVKIDRKMGAKIFYYARRNGEWILFSPRNTEKSNHLSFFENDVMGIMGHNGSVTLRL